MAANVDLPKWVWDLVIAMLNHEDEHGSETACLNAVVSAVPVDVRDQAEAIRAYVRSATQSVIKDHAEETWNRLMKGFSVLNPEKPSPGS